jgi:uncharacterized protein YdaU (DUF1376 family)
MVDSESTTKSPAFQFYPKDFLGDGDQAGMSLQETGAYARLMCFEWNAHGAGLPDDTTRCARMVGAPAGAMRKMWPAIRALFVDHPSLPGRMVHPRLERERGKQSAYRRRQSDAAAKRWQSHGNPTASARHMPQASQVDGLQSSVSSLQSTDSRQKTGTAATDARSKQPIFKGQRFVVFAWMLEDLKRMLGAHAEAFDLHAWFFDLDAEAVAANVVVPQRDGGRWVQERTHAEAVRRGLPIAAPANNSKTSGNLAAAARFVARGQR